MLNSLPDTAMNDIREPDAMTATAGLSDLPRLADEILKGQVQGRLVIDPAG